MLDINVEREGITIHNRFFSLTGRENAYSTIIMIIIITSSMVIIIICCHCYKLVLDRISHREAFFFMIQKCKKSLKVVQLNLRIKSAPIFSIIHWSHKKNCYILFHSAAAMRQKLSSRNYTKNLYISRRNWYEPVIMMKANLLVNGWSGQKAFYETIYYSVEYLESNHQTFFYNLYPFCANLSD